MQLLDDKHKQKADLETGQIVRLCSIKQILPTSPKQPFHHQQDQRRCYYSF